MQIVTNILVPVLDEEPIDLNDLIFSKKACYSAGQERKFYN